MSAKNGLSVRGVTTNGRTIEGAKTLATAGTVPGRDRTMKEFDVRKHTDRAGIPTTYADTNFRSRLEARWGALFDLAGWAWVYEPVDGDGYIPDFAILGDATFLVEIKPALDEAAYREPVPKIVAGIGDQWASDILILGAAPTLRDDIAGLTVDFLRGPDDWAVNLARWTYCPRCVTLGIATDPAPGWMRPCGHDAPKGGNPADLATMWATAGNAVQWRAA